MKPIYLFLFSIIILSGCVKIPNIHTSPLTVKILAFDNGTSGRDYACTKTASGSDYVDFDGTVYIKVPRSNGSNPQYDNFTSADFHSPTSTLKFPILVTIDVPDDGSAYHLEIYARSRDCSLCAARWTAQGETDAPCLRVQNSSGYSIAYPRWQAVSARNDHPAEIVVNYLFPDFNVPNTCHTCTVPF